MDKDGNEFHGLDDGRVHKEHGEQRISAIATQKDDRVAVATAREIPISHDDVMLSMRMI